MPHRIPLILALIAPGVAAAKPLDGVTACDLKRVASMYAMSPKQAKKHLKRTAKDSKVIDTERGPMSANVYYDVVAARKVPAKCSFDETSYTYADAELLAQVWGTDPEGAKRIVEDKILQGYEDGVTWALEDYYYQQKYGSKVDHATPDDVAWQMFWDSQEYTYCDAEVLAMAWGTDTYATKITIGYKVMNNDPTSIGILEQDLRSARQQAAARGHRCEFWATDLSYQDAEQLARVWGVSVEQAKVTAVDMVQRGQVRALHGLLGR